MPSKIVPDSQQRDRGGEELIMPPKIVSDRQQRGRGDEELIVPPKVYQTVNSVAEEARSS